MWAEMNIDDRQLAHDLCQATEGGVLLYTGDCKYTHATVRCPCGETVVTLPVNQGQHPAPGSWLLILHPVEGTFSLSPSIQHRGTCECHYYFNHGRPEPC